MCNCNYYTIGQFARLIGVSASTLREYDKNGTLVPHHRSPHGYRYYSDEQYQSFVHNKARPTVTSQ